MAVLRRGAEDGRIGGAVQWEPCAHVGQTNSARGVPAFKQAVGRRGVTEQCA